jgi:putative transposase
LWQPDRLRAGGGSAGIFEYIEVFYNRKWRHSALGYKSPTSFMKNWISAQHDEKPVA